MFTFKHPKYYKELRERNKLDQAISCAIGRRPSSGRAPGPGHKPQAASSKPQASGSKQQASSNKLLEVQVIHQDLSNLKLKK